jgi:SAM-dependent methyltransferase
MVSRLLSWLQRQRQRVERELVTIEQRRYLSPIFYAHYRIVLPLIRTHARGWLVDLGCGTAPFWPAVADQVTLYHGIDLWPRSAHISLVGDVQSLEMVAGNSYDSAICIEVLEHLPAPWLATGALSRILKPGGVAVISAPHLSRLHDLPHDYFRFTEFGLRSLLNQSGLEVVEVRVKGGLLTFLGHQLSTLLVAAAWSLPPLKPLILAANKWCVVLAAYHLDRVLGAHTFPQGYVVVARKPH